MSFFFSGENALVLRQSSSTFHPRRSHLKSPSRVQSLCTLPPVAERERPMASSRVRPCLTVVGVGGFDKEAATGGEGGAGEEADLRSFILERPTHVKYRHHFTEIILRYFYSCLRQKLQLTEDLVLKVYLWS